jgi:hypothetical protein
MLLKLSLLLRSTKNREALPNWLTFNPNTRTFQGTIPALRNLEIKLTATDTSGATASDVILMKLSKYGAVIDGYISSATLFLDANKNGVLDVGEPSATTDSNGEYNLYIPFDTFDKNQKGEIHSSEANLIAFGGTDTPRNTSHRTTIFYCCHPLNQLGCLLNQQRSCTRSSTIFGQICSGDSR